MFLLLLASLVIPSSSTPCPDGVLLPDPTDCSKFYKCHQGSLHSLECPASPVQLLWDVNLARCDWPQAVDCVKVALEESIPLATTVHKTDVLSHKNPFLAGLSLTGIPGGSSQVAGVESRVSGQPAGSLLVRTTVDTRQQGEKKMSVKFVPRDVAKYEKPLHKYQKN